MHTTILHRAPSLLRSACYNLGLFCTLLFAYTPMRAAVDATVPIDADAWVGSGAPAVNHNGTSLVASKNTKEIYLRFKLEVADVGTAPALTAKLRLRKTGGPAATMSIYAANNDWAEGTITWNGKPRVVDDTLLAADSVNSTNGWEEFIVTPYISGAGEYTLCVRTNATNDVTFSSKTGTYAPQLVFSQPNTAAEFTRTPTEVIARGEEFIQRYKYSNGDSGSSGYDSAEYDVWAIGYFDVTKQPYAAKGDGSADDTLAIQRAVNEARDARVAVYFPGHTTAYLVSNPIECVQGIVPYEISSNTYNERWNHREFPCILIGPSTAPRAKIRVKASSSAFASGQVPVLHFWSRDPAQPTANYDASSYNHLARNLDIDLNGKAGAIGIDMMGAQGTAIENLVITANGAYAGLKGLPGPGGSTSNVTIKGGKYGVDAYDLSIQPGYAPLLTHCTIDANGDANALNSVRWNGNAAMVLVGCDIKGKGMQIDGPSGNSSGASTRGNMSIVDSKIELTATGPAVTGSRSLYLRNVYCKQVNPVATIATADGDAGNVSTSAYGTNWFLVKEYAEGAVLNQYTGGGQHPWGDDAFDAEITPSYIANYNSSPMSLTTLITSDIEPVSETPASNFLDRHDWGIQLPMWNDSNVINVKLVSNRALGDNTTDDKAAIQAAINAAGAGQAVFIPRGHYALSDTLILRANTVLFGLHKCLSKLKAKDGAFSDHVDTRALVRTLNLAGGGATATTKLADVALFQRMTEQKCYLLDWQANQDSVVQNVNFDRRNVGAQDGDMTIPLVKISNSGGGRWYNFWVDGSTAQGAGYRHLQILNTTAPLRFYMFNPETDSAGIYNAEIDSCAHIDVFQSKMEGHASPVFHINSSSDIRWFGFGGNDYTIEGEATMEVVNSEKFLFSSQSFQFNRQSTATDPREFYRMKETHSTGTTTTPGQKQFVVYRRGTPSDN